VSSFNSSMRLGTTPDWRLRVSVTTAPVGFPITLDEVKAHLKITNNAEDAYLDSLIAAATDLAQRQLGRYFLPQTLTGYIDTRIYQDGLSGYNCAGAAFWGFWRTNPIALLGIPFVSLTDMTVIDDDGTEDLVDPATYFVDASTPDRPGRVSLKQSAQWPVTTNVRLLNAVRFVYEVGYATVPAGLKQGLLVLVAMLYANRGDCTCGTGNEGEAVNRALGSYKKLRI